MTGFLGYSVHRIVIYSINILDYLVIFHLVSVCVVDLSEL